MKTELLRSLSYGNFNIDQAKAVTRKTQDANKVEESLRKAGAGDRAKLNDVYIKSSKEAGNAESVKFQTRSQQVRSESIQFARIVSRGNVDVNKKMASLIATPINGTQPAVQIGSMLDTYA